ncbi:MBL fold metallo-hydrolase [Cohnella sp. REN36]|uniref:MBL fold metallo-hydrolase n=1 Tax=Cohnella sp. REN36 TaxID=2887347 RepID=UPI001D153473|nr:MBL fold metallo-hydrolase [Cohnella sp. REN36]MCC3375393.1 MBL fold metallo-hydrolase [Cohnella sp. REN36]
MNISPGIALLPISATMMGNTETIYPTLLTDDRHAVLVDAGYPGQQDLIRAALEERGVPLERLSAVLLTHQDLDHVGSLPALLEMAPTGIEVLAHEEEQPYIQGDRQPLKLSPEAIEAAVAALPDAVPDAWKQAFRRTLEQPPRAAVDRALTGGETLPYAGGVEVVATPGHTPGHISLYHPASRTLIAADALTVIEEELRGPDPRTTLDMPQALASIRRLASYEIATVICYHGGLYRGDVRARLEAIAGD